MSATSFPGIEQELTELKKSIAKLECLFEGDLSSFVIQEPDGEIQINTEIELFISEFGKVLDIQLEKLMGFWSKKFALESTFHAWKLKIVDSSVETTRKIYNGLAGFFRILNLTEMHEKVKKTADSEVKERRAKKLAKIEPQWAFLQEFSTSDEDLDFMVSMSIMALNGYIEDYLHLMEDLLVEKLLEQQRIADAREFLKKSSTSPSARIDNMLNVLGIRSMAKKILGSKFQESKRRAENFRKQRNLLSHTAETIELTDYKDEVETLSSSYLENLNWNGVSRLSEESLKDYRETMGSLIPKYFFIGRIAFDGLLYPAILDRCFEAWLRQA